MQSSADVPKIPVPWLFSQTFSWALLRGDFAVVIGSLLTS